MRLARTLLCLMLLAAASLAAAEERQRFILVMEANAMGINLSPWLGEFGKPAEAEIEALPTLNMMILSLPSHWQVDADTLCPHLTQLPEVKSCMADVEIKLQRPPPLTDQTRNQTAISLRP